jgi:hypothetical protein
MKRIMTMAMAFMAISVFGQNAGPSPCTSPKAHEFDFWIGKWTVYQTGTDKVVGYNTIVRIAGGCGIQENWEDVSGSSIGTSLNKYNFSTGKWQQFWIDNSGQTLELLGNYGDAKMTLSNPTNRITWFDNTDGTVRQLWEQTADSGKSWSVAFDGLYRKQP